MSIKAGTKWSIFYWIAGAFSASLSFFAVDWETIVSVPQWFAWGYCCVFLPLVCLAAGIAFFGRDIG